MKISVFFCLLISSVASVAQNNKSATYIPRMMHGIGATFQKFDGLNSRIAGFPQYKELREHMGTLQFGWLKERNKVISGLTFTAGSSMSGDRDKKSG